MYLKYTCKIQTSNICLCFLATQQFYEICKGVPIQIHASTNMLQSSDCHKGKQDSLMTAFSEKCLLQFIQNKKSLEIHVKIQFISKFAGYILES